MKFIITKHAQQRMDEREININEIRECINFPDYLIKKEDKFEAHKKINRKSLKIIYSHLGKFIKIITVIVK
jgi:hypothetical protein